MKRLLVANSQENNKRYILDNISIILKAQIENSLDLGWKTDDIILLSNFDFKYMGVKAQKIELNNFCFTGSKIFGVKYLFDSGIQDIIWASDLDCWQNVSFECPKFRDIGLTRYYNRNYNGGSIFWKSSSKDIIDDVVSELIKNNATREEPILNKVLKSKYKKRITVINHTFNVGCTGFVQRYLQSIKPICVYHFHPYNRIAWETHVLDRSKIGEGSISIRLERILRKYYPTLPIKLKGDFNEKTHRKNQEFMQSITKNIVKE